MFRLALHAAHAAATKQLFADGRNKSKLRVLSHRFSAKCCVCLRVAKAWGSLERGRGLCRIVPINDNTKAKTSKLFAYFKEKS